MTRQDRDLAIADNRAFIGAVIEEVALQWRVAQFLVFAGFSQGVAMAFRAACSSPRPVSGIIALGGDVPPELDGAALARTRTALLGRGQRDEWYSAELFATDAGLDEEFDGEGDGTKVEGFDDDEEEYDELDDGASQRRHSHYQQKQQNRAKSAKFKDKAFAYVCCGGCRDEFRENPAKYVKEYEEKKKNKK